MYRQMLQSIKPSIAIAAFLVIAVMAFGLRAQESAPMSKMQKAATGPAGLTQPEPVSIELPANLGGSTTRREAFLDDSAVNEFVSGDVPTLISPAAGAVLDNGRTDFFDEILWDFDWSNVPGATEYHLYVIGPNAQLPTIDWMDITNSSYHYGSNSYISEPNRLGWTWKVRAKVNGVWSLWSETRAFNVEPPNTDPPNPAELVADRVYLRTGPGSGSEVDNPVVGQQYYVHYDWRNTGSGGAHHFRIEIKLNGDELCSDTDRYAPGNSVHVNWCGTPVTWPAGTNTLDLALDVNNVIAEQNENNNSARRSFPCPETFTDNFNDGAADGWSPLTPGRWQVRSDAGSPRYFLNTTNYESPDGARLGELSVLSGRTWGDFTFECVAKSADAAAGSESADLCLVFGYQDFDSYYYAMFNSTAGLTALHRTHNGANVRLAAYNQPTFTNGLYHALKVERRGSQIRAFFDGVQVLSFVDSFFGQGQIGLGSFNDSGFFDNVMITGGPCLTPGVGPVQYTSHFIDDDMGGNSRGDGDGRAEHGERVELAVTLFNQGNQAATGLTASLATSDPDVTIFDNDNYWPDIPGGASRDNLGNFGFDVNPNLLQDKFVTFTMTVRANNGGPWTSTFVVVIYTRPTNRAPVVVNPIPNQTLTVGGSFVRDLNAAPAVFSDPDGDVLTYTTNSSDPSKATAAISGNTLTVTAIASGSATIAVTANDGKGGTASTTFAVTVNPISGATIKPVATSPQTIGAEFMVDVVVSAVQNLFGVSLELRYTNTAYVDVVTPTGNNVLPGPFMGNDVIFIANVDEAAGKVSIGISRKAGQGGVSGSGVVARVKFKSLATTPPGTQVVFSCNNVAASDPSGNAITLTASTLTVTITGIIVWPGDTNNDRVVNQADVLPLGLHWSRTGPARPNASLAWIGQPATPWSPEAATYADANGDGTVNQADILPVGLNWGKTHTFIPAAPLAKAEPASSATLVPEIISAPALDQEFVIRVNLAQATDLLGLAFELTYDRPDMLQILSVEPDESFGSNVVFYSKADNATGKIAVGISRKAGQASVYGSASAVRIKAKFSANARLGEIITFSLANAIANDSDGRPIEMRAQSLRLTIGATAAVAAENAMQLVTDFRLHQNSPNPFNPETLIRYELPEAGPILLKVYNFTGQEIRTLVNGFQQRGSYQISWDGRDAQGSEVPSGTYLYRLQAGSFSETRKMLLLR